MKVFNLTKINSGPEKQTEAEVQGTSWITNNISKITLVFMVFLLYSCAGGWCPSYLHIVVRMYPPLQQSTLTSII